jgi:hypothetical protein
MVEDIQTDCDGCVKHSNRAQSHLREPPRDANVGNDRRQNDDAEQACDRYASMKLGGVARLHGHRGYENLTRSGFEEGVAMRRIAFTLGLSVALLLVASATAEARAPDFQTFSYTYSGSVSCGSFVDSWTGSGTTRRTIFFDSAGNPRVRFLKGLNREIDVNSVTGKIVLVHTAVTERFDFRTGFTTYTGQVYMGVGPGHTRFIHDTGLLVFDADANIIRTAGPHTVLFGGDEPYCRALS